MLLTPGETKPAWPQDEAQALFDSFVEDPPSAEIAEILNAVGADTCPHGRGFCQGQCGVYRMPVNDGPYTEGRWEWRVHTSLNRRFWLYENLLILKAPELAKRVPGSSAWGVDEGADEKECRRQLRRVRNIVEELDNID